MNSVGPCIFFVVIWSIVGLIIALGSPATSDGLYSEFDLFILPTDDQLSVATISHPTHDSGQKDVNIVVISSWSTIRSYHIGSDETFGAESNPTGDPIGGGAGYSNTYTRTDPRVSAVVATKEQLITALGRASSDDVIFIDGAANIDLTGIQYGVTIPGGVTLASDRGYNGSPGGRIFQNRGSEDPTGGYPSALKTNGSNVRITGLRIEGPDMTISAVPGPKIGITNGYNEFVVDNCELYGWSWAGILVYSSSYGYFHHNFIHDCQMDGLGYGIAVTEGSESLIEANLMDNNRCDVASSGKPGDSYEARYNIILEHKSGTGHCFDMHSGYTDEDGRKIAGNTILIHHNTIKVADHYSVGIQGVPLSGAYIDHNWMVPNNQVKVPEYASVFQRDGQSGVFVFRNLFGSKRIPVEVGPIIRIS